MKACNQCGKCCIKYADGGLSASKEEIKLWELFNPEIFDYVKNGEIWFDPATGQPLQTCPFLESETVANGTNILYTCSIYKDRPDDCRQYPSLVSEMIRDNCEMIEVTDITHPTRAQQKLNALMQRK